MDYKSLVYKSPAPVHGGSAPSSATPNQQQNFSKVNSFYANVPNLPSFESGRRLGDPNVNPNGAPGGNQIYPFNFVPPVSFNGSAYNFTVPDIAASAAQYQTSLDPRFNALRDSRTSQLRADFDFLRQKEFERLNQRGAIGSGVENQQIGRFNTEFSRQLSDIDKELIAAQQKEAFDLAAKDAELKFRVQSAAAENRLNTEIAKAETALKSGQLTLAERELYLKRIQQLMDAQNELMKRKNEFLNTPGYSDSDGNSVTYDNIFNSGSTLASSVGSLYGGNTGSTGSVSDSIYHLNTANG